MTGEQKDETVDNRKKPHLYNVLRSLRREQLINKVIEGGLVGLQSLVRTGQFLFYMNEAGVFDMSPHIVSKPIHLRQRDEEIYRDQQPERR